MDAYRTIYTMRFLTFLPTADALPTDMVPRLEPTHRNTRKCHRLRYLDVVLPLIVEFYDGVMHFYHAGLIDRGDSLGLLNLLFRHHILPLWFRLDLHRGHDDAQLLDQVLPFVYRPRHLANQPPRHSVPGSDHQELIGGEVAEQPGSVAEQAGLEEEVELIRYDLASKPLYDAVVGELPNRCAQVHVALRVDDGRQPRVRPLVVQLDELPLRVLFVLRCPSPDLRVDDIPGLPDEYGDDPPLTVLLPAFPLLAQL